MKKIFTKYKNMPAAAKASLWFVICGFLQRGISTITTPIFTRILSTDDYGVYSVFNSWLEIITIVATLRLCYGVYVQGLVKYSDDRDRYSSSLLGLTTVWVGAFAAIYAVFSGFWNNLLGLNTTMMTCMFFIMLSVVAFDFWAVRERNAFQYKKLVILTLTMAVINPACGVGAVLLSETNKAQARIISMAITQFLIYLFLYIKIMRHGKCFYNQKYWKYALTFNLPLIPHFLSQFILNHSDRLMINALIGSSEAGIYSLAYSIAAILSMLNTSIENSLRPWVFQQLKDGKEKQIQSVSLGALLVVAFFNLLLIAFAPEVVSVFAPSSYRGAISIIPPITMGIYFAFVYNIFVDIEMYYEKNKGVMIASTAGAVLNLVLNYLLIPQYGYQAAAYTTLISYMFIAVLHYIFMKKVLKENAKGIVIYELKRIVIISLIFVGVGTMLSIASKWWVCRYCAVLLFIAIVFSNKNKISKVMGKLKNKGK